MINTCVGWECFEPWSEGKGHIQSKLVKEYSLGTGGKKKNRGHWCGVGGRGGGGGGGVVFKYNYIQTHLIQACYQ